MLGSFRRRLGALIGGFEAAQGSRRLKGFQPSRAHVNTLIAAAGSDITARARYLVRNNGYALNAAESWTGNAVGTGIKPSSLIADKDLKTLVQQLWLAWTDESDAEGLTDFYGQQRRAAREVFIAGEVFFRLRPRRPEDGLTVPLQLQMLPSEMLPLTRTEVLPNGNTIRQGIEFDRIGRRAAYWFLRRHPGDLTDPGMVGEMVRVPAAEIIHVIDPVESGQLRGVSRLAPAIVKLFLLDQYDDAELERKKIAAMYAMFVISPAPADVIDMVPADDGSGDRIVEVQPGQVVPLEPGEQIQTSAPADVGGSYEPFEYRTLLQISAATGIPYAYLSNDMLKANYSNSRMALLEFRRRVEAWQHSVMVHQMCRVVWQRWMDVAVLSGALDIPGYERNRASFIACSWLPPKWDWVDPLAEAVRSSDRTKVRDVTIDNDVAKFARSHKLAEDDPKVDKYRAARSRQYAEAVKDEARQTTLAYDATLRFKDELAKLNEQRASGTLSEEAYTRRYKELEQDKLAASRDWQDGAIRAVRAYADEAANAAASAERAMSGALRASEDAFVKWAMTGKLAGQDLFNSLAEEALRAAWRMSVVAPLFGGAGGGIFGGMIAGIGSFFSGTASTGSGGGSVPVPSTGNFAIAHTGGLIGLDRLETRSYSPSVFANAPKYHTGGLVAGERPIVARVGEGVFTPKQMDNADRILNAALSQPTAVGVVVTVNNHASGTQARAEQSHGADGRIQLDIIVEEIEGRMNRRIGRGEGMAPVLEHRYGLNPAAGTYR